MGTRVYSYGPHRELGWEVRASIHPLFCLKFSMELADDNDNNDKLQSANRTC